MAADRPITTLDAVVATKMLAHSTTAKNIAADMSERTGAAITSRAVATALRAAVADGRVTLTYRKGRGFYRFVRLTPKVKP